jgi:hypothetical protein
MDEPNRKVYSGNEGQTVYNGSALPSNNDVTTDLSELCTNISTRPLVSPYLHTRAEGNQSGVRDSYYRATCVQELQGKSTRLAAVSSVYKPEVINGSGRREERRTARGNNISRASYRTALLAADRRAEGVERYVRNVLQPKRWSEQVECAMMGSNMLDKVKTLLAVGSSVFVVLGFVGWSYHLAISVM